MARRDHGGRGGVAARLPVRRQGRRQLLLNDSLYYSIQAGRNSEGDWFREALTDLPGAEHGPLTSLYLTPWSLGAGDNVAWQRFATTLLGIATVAVIGLLGRRLAGPARRPRRRGDRRRLPEPVDQRLAGDVRVAGAA